MAVIKAMLIFHTADLNEVIGGYCDEGTQGRSYQRCIEDWLERMLKEMNSPEIKLSIYVGSFLLKCIEK